MLYQWLHGSNGIVAEFAFTLAVCEVILSSDVASMARTCSSLHASSLGCHVSTFLLRYISLAEYNSSILSLFVDHKFKIRVCSCLCRYPTGAADDNALENNSTSQAKKSAAAERARVGHLLVYCRFIEQCTILQMHINAVQC
jgi:hypothetical protein